MKLLLIFALVLALALPLGGCADKQDTAPGSTAIAVDYGPHRPVGIYAVEEQLRDNDFWEQTTTVAERNAIFDKAREDFFKYFYNLWGFDVTVTRGDADRFADTEVLHSVCVRLSLASKDSTTVFSKAELNAAAKQYFGQTIENFTGCSACSYNSETARYTWNSGCSVPPGHYMVLRQLRVQEDGLCVGIFDRSHAQYLVDKSDSAAMHTTVLNGVYDDLSRVDTVTVTFREGKAEGETFLQILSIVPYTGLGSHTK